MLSAEEAFEKSKQKLEDTVQTIDELLELDKKIKDAVDKGYFCTHSEPMLPVKAEKLAIEVEEYGFSCGVQGTGMIDAEKNPLVVVSVNWKFKPFNTRIKQPESV